MADWHWSGYGFKAMNTEVYAWLYTDAGNSSQILQEVQGLFASLERRLSRFDPGSELSRLNRTAGVFKASPTLFEAVKTAVWAAEASGGLFDPTILPALAAAGYDASFETVAPAGPLPASPPRPRPGHFRHLVLNPGGYTIDKPAGLTLDLGGIGKGWTVDRAADRLLGLGPFLVNAGGDLYAYGAPPGEPGWQVTIPHPLDEGRDLATLRVENRAVATSSVTRRRWRRGGRMMHHLIDPRTARPADTDLLAVTVIGERVALAEVLAKVALLLGAAPGLAYLEATPNVEGLLVAAAGQTLATSGWNRYSA